MPGFLNHVGETACLNGGFRATAGAASFWVALATNAAGSITDTTAMASIVEPTDTAYARKQMASSGQAFTAPTQENGKTVIKNVNQIDFTAWAANASAAINYALIVDSATKGAGNIYAVIPLEDSGGNPAPITPQATQPARIASNALVISLD